MTSIKQALAESYYPIFAPIFQSFEDVLQTEPEEETTYVELEDPDSCVRYYRETREGSIRRPSTPRSCSRGMRRSVSTAASTPRSSLPNLSPRSSLRNLSPRSSLRDSSATGIPRFKDVFVTAVEVDTASARGKRSRSSSASGSSILSSTRKLFGRHTPDLHLSRHDKRQSRLSAIPISSPKSWFSREARREKELEAARLRLLRWHKEVVEQEEVVTVLNEIAGAQRERGKWAGCGATWWGEREEESEEDEEVEEEGEDGTESTVSDLTVSTVLGFVDED